MKQNILRQLLKEGKPSLCTNVVSPWPAIVEIIGRSGVYDYIEYSGEGSPFSLEQLDNFGRTIELFPEMSSMIKVDEHNRGFIATRAVDAGIQNVNFAGCTSAEEVRECIRMVKPSTPEIGGTHGFSQRRALDYGLGQDLNELVKAMNETVICIAIENKAAVDHVEEMLSVPGVDMIYFGPQDYSTSIGKPGKREDPKVIKARDKVFATAVKKGIAIKQIIGKPDQMKQFMDMGVRHFSYGNDLRILDFWYRGQGAEFRDLMGKI